MTTVASVASMRKVTRSDMAQLATTEYQRLLQQLRSLDATDWMRPTGCSLWTVRDVVAHLVGAVEFCRVVSGRADVPGLLATPVLF